MINDDGSFQLEFIDDSAPGIFMPATTIVHGRLSPAAAKYFAAITVKSSSERVESLLRAAVKTRRRIAGPRAEELIVRTTDFGR